MLHNCQKIFWRKHTGVRGKNTTVETSLLMKVDSIRLLTTSRLEDSGNIRADRLLRSQLNSEKARRAKCTERNKTTPARQ
jgi:hypothetical protein